MCLLAVLAVMIGTGPATLVAARDSQAGAGSDEGTSLYQLRIYEIFPHNKAAFHTRFRDHALRIMQRYDFNIRAMWEASFEGRTEFCYLLEWPDQATLEDRWTRFLADEEWIRIKQDSAAEHGALVGAIEDRTLHTLSYGPRLTP